MMLHHLYQCSLRLCSGTTVLLRIFTHTLLLLLEDMRVRATYKYYTGVFSCLVLTNIARSDLVVHRLLAACIGYDKTYSAELVDKLKVADLSDSKFCRVVPFIGGPRANEPV
jgi:hypothetical protein